MVDILETLHKYVPTTSSEVGFQHPDTGEESTLKVDHFKHLLVGGDQLTVARIRSAQLVRQNSNTSSDRLEGMVPFIQDWHAKLCFLQVNFTHAAQSFKGVYEVVIEEIGKGGGTMHVTQQL